MFGTVAIIANTLHQCRVACARYGGPIATVRDERKMVLVSGGTTQPLVKIYNSAGSQLGYFLWDKGRIEAMGWTNAETLMIVEQTGEVITDCKHSPAAYMGQEGKAQACGRSKHLCFRFHCFQG